MSEQNEQYISYYVTVGLGFYVSGKLADGSGRRLHKCQSKDEAIKLRDSLNATVKAIEGCKV